MTICLLDIPSTIIHRDSPEGKKQTEREAALELQRRRHVVTSEEPEENKAEEISDLRKKVKSRGVSVVTSSWTRASLLYSVHVYTDLRFGFLS